MSTQTQIAQALRLLADAVEGWEPPVIRAPRPVPDSDVEISVAAAVNISGIERARLLRLTRGMSFRHTYSRRRVTFLRDAFTAWASTMTPLERVQRKVSAC